MKRPSCTGAGRFCFDCSTRLFDTDNYRTRTNMLIRNRTERDRIRGRGARRRRAPRVDEGTGH